MNMFYIPITPPTTVDMSEDRSTYEVIVSGGRGSDVVYREARGELRFWWEYVHDGVLVQVPGEHEWDQFCAAQGAPWAAGQRGQVLARVLKRLEDGKARGMDPEPQPDGILFRMRPRA